MEWKNFWIAHLLEQSEMKKPISRWCCGIEFPLLYWALAVAYSS